MEVAGLLLRGLAGSILITGIGAASDRAHPYFGSLLAAVPTTSAITLLFMALDHSPAFAAQAALWSLATQVGNLLFALAFAALALRVPGRSPAWVPAFAALAFPLAAGLSVAAWRGGAATPLPQVAAFAAVAAFAFAARRALLRRAPPHEPSTRPPPRSRHVQRAVLGGAIVVAALWLARAAGPEWGGLFSSVPATFVTLLVVTYRTRNLPYFLEQDLALVPNVCALACYILAVHLAYPALGVVWGTLVAYAAFLAVALPLAALRLRQTAGSAPGLSSPAPGPEQG